ncbi:Inorganic pyrophosphatase [Tolypocladium ophioglossoides CBS 100239]|uniref:Inorganic pyrophosphatase n=1 Tax=Tolypocladium ophioglossoides (strain CBS 100239) TaxID=1163406 RepID=A0A0L0NLU4_TOLOC|nr:Inorganic pyrophosphatase [Tolypocladium ophioglossoides CBS 100239]
MTIAPTGNKVQYPDPCSLPACTHHLWYLSRAPLGDSRHHVRAPHTARAPITMSRSSFDGSLAQFFPGHRRYPPGDAATTNSPPYRNRALSIRSGGKSKSSSSGGPGGRTGFSFNSLRGTVQPELSRKLFRLIKSENNLITAHETAGRERISIAQQLSEWGEQTGDDSISDVSDKVGVILSEIGEQEDTFAHALDDSRGRLKTIRNTEKSVQPSRDGKAKIADEIAKLKMKEPESARLVVLEQELVRAEAENLVAEAQLTNITRQKLKGAYEAEFAATIERAEKQIILAKHGRRLLDLLDDTPVVPGDTRQPYAGGQQARQVLNDCEDDLRDWQPDHEETYTDTAEYHSAEAKGKNKETLDDEAGLKAGETVAGAGPKQRTTQQPRCGYYLGLPSQDASVTSPCVPVLVPAAVRISVRRRPPLAPGLPPSLPSRHHAAVFMSLRHGLALKQHRRRLQRLPRLTGWANHGLVASHTGHSAATASTTTAWAAPGPLAGPLTRTLAADTTCAAASPALSTIAATVAATGIHTSMGLRAPPPPSSCQPSSQPSSHRITTSQISLRRTAQIARHLLSPPAHAPSRQSYSTSSAASSSSSSTPPSMASQYSIRKVAAPNTFDHRVYIEKDGVPVSPFHDIPLYANQEQTILNMVVEIPRWTNAKLEISKEELLNPIKQDIKKGKLRYVRNCFPHKGYLWNYGAFPQTWEDPNAVHPETKAKGDNDPLDVCEIGELVGYTGQIKQVKVLGVMALLDEDETDWKVIVIDINDPLASKLNDIEDVERHLPGLLRATNEWFRIYKIPDGKPENQFAFTGECKNKKYAMDVVHECSEAWDRLITGKTPAGSVSIANTTVVKSNSRLSPDQLPPLPPHQEVPAAKIDSSIDKWFFISGASS